MLKPKKCSGNCRSQNCGGYGCTSCRGCYDSLCLSCLTSCGSPGCGGCFDTSDPPCYNKPCGTPKCGGCTLCMRVFNRPCTSRYQPCTAPSVSCPNPKCPSSKFSSLKCPTISCPAYKSKGPCAPVECIIYPPCPPCPTFGMKVSLNIKREYEQEPVEVTPRASCVLTKPMAVRSCHHIPECIPPSPLFPFLEPCYLPSRPSAPCAEPSQCFHNPPCLPKRKRKSRIPLNERCPTIHPCENPSMGIHCTNQFCRGKNQAFIEQLKKRFGVKVAPPKAATVSIPATAPRN